MQESAVINLAIRPKMTLFTCPGTSIKRVNELLCIILD